MLITRNAQKAHEYDYEEVNRVFNAAVKAAIDGGKYIEKRQIREADQEEFLLEMVEITLLKETGKTKDTFEVPGGFDLNHLVSRIVKEAKARSVILQRLQEDA